MAKSYIKKRMIGHNVSHSNVKTKRTFKVNAISKNFTLNSKNKSKLKLSTSMLRTWRKHGGTAEALERLLIKGDN